MNTLILKGHATQKLIINANSNGEIMAYIKPDAQSDWSQANHINQTFAAASNANIVGIKKKGAIKIFWINTNGNLSSVCFDNNGQWQAETEEVTDINARTDSKLAIKISKIKANNIEDLFILAQDQNNKILCLRQTNNTWQATDIISGNAASGTDITLIERAAGHIDVFWIGNDNHLHTNFWITGHQAWNGSWPLRETANTIGSDSRIFARSNNKDIEIVYTQPSNHGRLYYLRHDTVAKRWETANTICQGTHVAHTSPVDMDISSDGTVTAFWHGTNGKIHSRSKQSTTGEWGKTFTIPSDINLNSAYGQFNLVNAMQRTELVDNIKLTKIITLLEGVDRDTFIAAAKEGDIANVIRGINNGIDVNQTSNLNNTSVFEGTALHYAAKYGHANIICYLLKNNADVNATIVSGHQKGASAAYYAVRQHPLCVKAIISQPAYQDMLTTYNANILHSALDNFRSAHNPLEILDLVLTTQVNVNQQADKYKDGAPLGTTPFHWLVNEAQQNKEDSAVNLALKIFQNHKVDLSLKDSQGKTAIDYASQKGLHTLAGCLRDYAQTARFQALENHNNTLTPFVDDTRADLRTMENFMQTEVKPFINQAVTSLTALENFNRYDTKPFMIRVMANLAELTSFNEREASPFMTNTTQALNWLKTTLGDLTVEIVRITRQTNEINNRTKALEAMLTPTRPLNLILRAGGKRQQAMQRENIVTTGLESLYYAIKAACKSPCMVEPKTITEKEQKSITKHLPDNDHPAIMNAISAHLGKNIVLIHENDTIFRNCRIKDTTIVLFEREGMYSSIHFEDVDHKLLLVEMLEQANSLNELRYHVSSHAESNETDSLRSSNPLTDHVALEASNTLLSQNHASMYSSSFSNSELSEDIITENNNTL